MLVAQEDLNDSQVETSSTARLTGIGRPALNEYRPRRVVPMNSKHFHVISGLAGGYLPNTNYTFSTKSEALNEGVRQAEEYREMDEKVRGSRKQGFWMARQGSFGEMHDYIEVSGPCFEAEHLTE